MDRHYQKFVGLNSLARNTARDAVRIRHDAVGDSGRGNARENRGIDHMQAGEAAGRGELEFGFRRNSGRGQVAGRVFDAGGEAKARELEEARQPPVLARGLLPFEKEGEAVMELSCARSGRRCCSSSACAMPRSRSS